MAIVSVEAKPAVDQQTASAKLSAILVPSKRFRTAPGHGMVALITLLPANFECATRYSAEPPESRNRHPSGARDSAARQDSCQPDLQEFQPARPFFALRGGALAPATADQADRTSDWSGRVRSRPELRHARGSACGWERGSCALNSRSTMPVLDAGDDIVISIPKGGYAARFRTVRCSRSENLAPFLKPPTLRLSPDLDGSSMGRPVGACRFGICLFADGRPLLNRSRRAEIPKCTAQEAGGNLRATNPEAQDLYLQGRYYWNKRTPEGLNKAVDYFTQAIVRDPSYAPAYVRTRRFLQFASRVHLHPAE